MQRPALFPVISPRVLSAGFPVCSLHGSCQRHDRIRPENNRSQLTQRLLNITSQLISDRSDRCISPGILPEVPVVHISESLQLSERADPPSELPVRHGSYDLRAFVKPCILHLRELLDRLEDRDPQRLPSLIQLGKILIELAPLLFEVFKEIRDSGPEFPDRRIQCIYELLDHSLLLRLVVVKRQAVIRQSDILEPSVDHAERSHLLRDKQDLLSARQGVGNDIGYGLALPRAGRSLKDKAYPFPGELNGILLARVRVYDQVRFFTGNTVMVEPSPFRPDRRKRRGISAECLDHRIDEDLLTIFFKILVHDDLEKGQQTEIYFSDDSPSHGLNCFLDPSHEGFYVIPFAVRFREADPVLGRQHVLQSGIEHYVFIQLGECVRRRNGTEFHAGRHHDERRLHGGI